MTYYNEVQLRQPSPLTRRKRRHAQQQSACCGCVLAVVLVVLVLTTSTNFFRQWRTQKLEEQQARERSRIDFPLALSTNSPDYLRYDLISLKLKITGPDGQPRQISNPPKIYIRHNGQLVETIGGLERVQPAWNITGESYSCNWPVPWNAEPGRYTAEVRLKIDKAEEWLWETEAQHEKDEKTQEQKPDTKGAAWCIARADFEIKARPPVAMPPGICAATWEAMIPRQGTRIRNPQGQWGDWRTIVDWCEFMGADTLWVRGAVTEATNVGGTLDKPFVQSNLDGIGPLAAEAKRRGLKFGAWAVAFNTLPENPGSNRRKPPYTFAKDVSRSRGQVAETSFISFKDRYRVDHLAQFFAKMQAEPNVDHVGLDYMRTEPGYELADQFGRDMPVALPEKWAKMNSVERMKYVAQRAEPPGCFEAPDFYDAWNWYRAHTGSKLIAAMIEKAKLKKPLWIFVLSWRHGTQHGQDPHMFTDAGVTVLAPMLYQTTKEHYDRFILKDWNKYVKPGQMNLSPGDQVDNYWHQQMGPGELYRRMVAAHRQFINGGVTSGSFLHDISRAAVVGNLGPYPGTEWALAGGAAFSTIRRSWQVYPLEADLTVPQKVKAKESFTVNLTLHNIVKNDVQRIEIYPMKTDGVILEDTGRRLVQKVGAGETLTLPFKAKIDALNPERKNKFMVAYRITWPRDKYGDQTREDLPPIIIAMQYVTAN